MRTRFGNPFRDQHELRQPWSMHIYDFVTLPHTDAADVARAIEVICPDLAVYGRGEGQTKRQLFPKETRLLDDLLIDVREGERSPAELLEMRQITVLPDDYNPAKAGWVSGAVWTSTRPDGSLYVALGTYAQTCNDPECDAGHGRQMQVRQGRAISKAEQNAIKDLIGESDDWPLGAGYDVEVLTGLGFLPVDAPLLGVEVTDTDIYRGLDALLLSDTATWWFKVAQMDAAGFEVEFSRQRPEVWDALAKHANVSMIREPAGVA